MNPEVLYVDNHVLCVSKPAGMLTQGDITGDFDLLSWCRQYIEVRFNKPGRAFIGLVHRLDRPASGVVLFARTSKAAARLSRQFRDREVSKKYLAVVEGRMTGSGVLTHRMRKKGRGVVEANPTDPEGRLAELRWRAIASDDRATLVEADLKTGRKHQIRFQLASAGHPIIGDMRYGATDELDGRNIALHCYHLAVDHPTLRKRVGWTAPTPASWRILRSAAESFIRLSSVDGPVDAT